MAVRPTQQPALSLADLIDLELALLRDRDRPIEVCDARDAPIAARLAADPPSSRRGLVLAWLAATRGPEPSLGARIVELREGTSGLLFVAGALLGGSAIGGWLLTGTGTPVNVVKLWPAVVGLQLVLLGAWCVGAAPLRLVERAPGARGLAALTRRTAEWIAGAASRVMVRGAGGAELRAALAELHRLDWLYGRLRLWVVTGITQSFGVGLNLGALVATIGIPIVDDPAFGWRSLQLDPPQLHVIARAIGTPWRGWLPQGVPTLEQVEESRYSSLDARFEAGSAQLVRDDPEVWAAWWPFLLMSILTYGLLPRAALLALATARTRAILRRTELDHADCQRLIQRLQQLRIDPTVTATDHRTASTRASAPISTPELRARTVAVLAWAGVTVSDDEIATRLAERGATLAGSIARVGGLDLTADDRAIRSLEGLADGASILILVESFEPPVGDYMELCRRARAVAGDGVAIWVALCGLPPDATAHPDDVAMWARALGELADPWIHVLVWSDLAPPGKESS